VFPAPNYGKDLFGAVAFCSKPALSESFAESKSGQEQSGFQRSIETWSDKRNLLKDVVKKQY